MKTEVLQIDADRPAPAAIARASAILREGGLVAFPTETVYGLGANALDPAAVERIFQAKGRPPRNPIIVHVADVAGAADLVTEWPESAQRLAERFWPGPLTLVMSKSGRIPDVVTAGGATVGLRVPAHPVARALLRHCALPIAAPSANPSSALSPTRGEHVLRALKDRFELLLDAGPSSGGLESTVLDLTHSPARLLRPGLIRKEALERTLGELVVAFAGADEGTLPSPGLLARHYAPRTPTEIIEGKSWSRVRELASLGLRIGWLTFAVADDPPANVTVMTLSTEPERYATSLYAALHGLDGAGLDVIVIELPPATDEWVAVRDRLRRAASSK